MQQLGRHNNLHTIIYRGKERERESETLHFFPRFGDKNRAGFSYFGEGEQHFHSFQKSIKKVISLLQGNKIL